MKKATIPQHEIAALNSQNNTVSITDMHLVLQHLTSIMNGLTLKIQVGTILTLLMMATAATIGGCSHV